MLHAFGIIVPTRPLHNVVLFRSTPKLKHFIKQIIQSGNSQIVAIRKCKALRSSRGMFKLI
jgi:hypothetical protein